MNVTLPQGSSNSGLFAKASDPILPQGSDFTGNLASHLTHLTLRVCLVAMIEQKLYETIP